MVFTKGLDLICLPGHLIPAGSMFAFLRSPKPRCSVTRTTPTCSPRRGGAVRRSRLPRWLPCWRKGLARSARPHLVNDAVKVVIEQTVVMKGRRRRAVDSTILADAVATQGHCPPPVAAVSRLARELPGAAGGSRQRAPGTTPPPDEPKINGDDPEARDALASAPVGDAKLVAAALQDRDLEGAAPATRGRPPPRRLGDHPQPHPGAPRPSRLPGTATRPQLKAAALLGCRSRRSSPRPLRGAALARRTRPPREPRPSTRGPRS
jgi:hypothetical protein